MKITIGGNGGSSGGTPKPPVNIKHIQAAIDTIKRRIKEQKRAEKLRDRTLNICH